MENQSKVWYVTGASDGLGLNLVKQLLAAGYRVAATAESKAELEDAVGDTSSNFLALEVNLSREDTVIASLQTAADTFGNIDVVVNNAAQKPAGRFEEFSDKQARANFEINVFGMMNVIRNAMSHFRPQQSGHIFNISSAAASSGKYSGLSIHCATRFAVAGLSESLAAEAKPFGIHVTVVLPDQFRSSLAKEEEATTAAEPAVTGNTASAMISIAQNEEPPLYLFLSKASFLAATERLDSVKKDMCLWPHT